MKGLVACMYCLFLCLAFLSPFNHVFGEELPCIFVSPGQSTASFGEIFWISINISNAVGASAWGVNVGFDPGLLMVRDYVFGDFLSQAGSTITAFGNHSMIGFISAGEAMQEPATVSGNGTLMSLCFEVRGWGGGDCALRLFDTTLFDADLNPIVHTAIDGGFSVPAFGNATIYIRQDGSVEPLSAPITRFGNVYILTSDVTVDPGFDGIVIERDNATLYGHRHVIQGSGSGIGIEATRRSGVLIVGLEINGFDKGVKLGSLRSQSQSYTHGDVVSGNAIINNSVGIWLSHVSDVVISDNTITGNSWLGVHVAFSANNRICENTIAANGGGIMTQMSTDTAIVGNEIHGNIAYGVYIEQSSHECVLGNSISMSTGYSRGVYAFSSSNCNVVGNLIVALDYPQDSAGLYFLSCSNNTVIENEMSQNLMAVWLDRGSTGNVFDSNNLTDGILGIVLYSSSENNVFLGNRLQNNVIGVYILESSANTFYHNIFVYNGQQVADASQYWPEYEPSVNNWDSGYPSGGNSWSDYSGIDFRQGLYQNLPGSDGIGDVPYIIDSNNRDRYPFALNRLPFYTRLYGPPEWSGEGTPEEWHADDGSWACSLPFSFPFYDGTYDTIYVSSNGLITFTGYDASFSNSIWALSGKLAIVCAWDDWQTYSPNDIYVWQDSTHIGIRWHVQALYDANITADFEVILSADGVIQFNYEHDSGPISATIGISNGAGQMLAEDVSNLNSLSSVIFTPHQPRDNYPGSFVSNCYRDLLLREPDPEGLAYWTNEIESGRLTYAGFVEVTLASEEYQIRWRDGLFVALMYNGVFERSPSQEEYNYWVSLLGSSSVTREQMLDTWLNSTEWSTNFGDLNNTEFVTKLYRNMLNREPDNEGLAHWINELENSTMTRSQIILLFYQCDEYQYANNAQKLVYQLYLGLLGRVPETEGYHSWTESLRSGVSREEAINAFLVCPEYESRHS